MSDLIGLLGSSSLPTRGVTGLFVRLFIAELMAHQAMVNKEINSIGAAAAKRCQTIQKQLVPVDTGALRDSITVERYNRGEEPDGWAIGPDLPYGRFVEWGTSRFPPNPYVGPSGDAVEGPYYEAIKRVVFGFWS